MKSIFSQGYVTYIGRNIHVSRLNNICTPEKYDLGLKVEDVYNVRNDVMKLITFKFTLSCQKKCSFRREQSNFFF